MYRIALIISLMGFLLFACAVTDKILPASKLTFITATVGLPEIQPTPTFSSTFTPLPEQAYAMTENAKVTPDRSTRIVTRTKTNTATMAPTNTLKPSSLTGTAIARQTEATVIATIACRPEYPDFCIPYGNRKTCKEWLALGYTNFKVRKPDSLNYDKNADGIGCND
jgi:hypothetical protein